jgi:uncharacterized membrane protein YoaK (UPF0700 family)
MNKLEVVLLIAILAGFVGVVMYTALGAHSADDE